MERQPTKEVMILCPKTKVPVPVGIMMDKMSFDGSKMTNMTFAPCMACGQAHTWNTEDAFLAGDEPKR